MSSAFPSGDDLAELKDAAGCVCCVSGSCDLILPVGVVIRVNDYASYGGYTTEAWNYGAAPCSPPNYRKRLRIYPPQSVPGATYSDEIITCEPGPVPSFTSPHTYTDAEWPVESPGGYEYEVTFIRRTATYDSLNGIEAPLVLTAATGTWANSAFLRMIVSIGVEVSQIRGIYHYVDQIYCDGVLHVPPWAEDPPIGEPPPIEFHYSPWVGVGGDPLTERTIDIDIPPPAMPPEPAECAGYEEGWEVRRTLVLDGVQCVGYTLVVSDEAVYCYDEFGGPVDCGDPAAVFCYDSSFNSVPCP